MTVVTVLRDLILTWLGLSEAWLGLFEAWLGLSEAWLGLSEELLVHTIA